MKICFHHRPGSFSEEWIKFCEMKRVNYEIINLYDNDAMSRVRKFNAIMWHYSNYEYKDALFAKQFLFSLEQAGKMVFPDFNSSWHFDDKVGQKYLLESINAPFAPSYIFFTKKDALSWVDNAIFPKVFKLRTGSGSSNVKLVNNKKEARKLIAIAFGRGFPKFDRINNFQFRVNNYLTGREGVLGVGKGFYRLLFGNEFSSCSPKEKGYVYFQDFMPGNEYDTRVVVIGKRAIAEKRFVRKNDFRASGSGDCNFEDIDIEIIKVAFEISKKLGLSSVAFDFILNADKKPVVVELSYGFGTKGICKAPGFWDFNLNWHPGEINPGKWIIKDFIAKVESNS